jgi:SAM-dependent methyltransferase
VLGYGYSKPFLSGYQANTHRTIYALPALQGAQAIASQRGNASVQIQDHQLPFMPGVFDRVLVAHGLEETPRLNASLRELWRVMKPEGRIVIIAANRSGLWARSDKTPFGAGRPFSRTQLSRCLKTAGFEPLVRAGALYAPPIDFLCSKTMGRMFETFGETVWPGFSGLVLVEAVKRMYVGDDARQKKKILRPNFKGAGVLGTAGKSYQRNTELDEVGHG